MKAFEIYIVDDRYSIPTLHIVTAVDEAQARDIAAGLLAESAHHLSVEVSEQGRTLFVVDDPAAPAGAAASGATGAQAAG